jgi:MOSC domain-containing protein YiiM
VLDEFGLEPGAVREQITTQGVPLHTLPEGTRLSLGAVRVTLTKPCTPCLRMDEVQPGLQEALVGRRGRFVRVHEDGEVAVGDIVDVDAGGAV